MPLLAPEPYVHPEHLLDAPAGADVGAWWVLHTRPRAEKTLARRFLDRGVPFFLPVYKREWRNQGRLFRSYLPLFPGYVFLHGGHDCRTAALETNLVARVLPVADQRQLHADLTRVYRLITTGAPVTPEDRLEPGDPVAIVHGPLAGLDGKVIRRGKHLKFFVEVQLLRRAVSAEVEGWMIRPRQAAG
jgi:transcriptional antiterminator RfaH